MSKSFHHMNNVKLSGSENWRLFGKHLSLLGLKSPVKMPSNRFVLLVLDAGTVAAKVHWIILPLTLPLTEFTAESDWMENQMTKGTMRYKKIAAVWRIGVGAAGSQQQPNSFSENWSYPRYGCQCTIVQQSRNELHNAIVICANIRGVITSLWHLAKPQTKEVYTRASITCGLD